MKRLLNILWNVTCCFVSCRLVIAFTPGLLAQITDAPIFTPLLWPGTAEMMFRILAIAICGVSLSSIFMGRLKPARRVTSGILAFLLLGTWIYSSIQWIGGVSIDALSDPSLFGEMMENDGMAYAVTALACLLTGALTGRGLFLWLGKLLASATGNLRRTVCGEFRDLCGMVSLTESQERDLARQIAEVTELHQVKMAAAGDSMPRCAGGKNSAATEEKPLS